MMAIKNKLKTLCDRVSAKFFEQFGFYMREINVDNLTDHFHKPKDSSSLAVTRFFFGLAMLFDIPAERGGAVMHQRWGNTQTCHFPLIPFLQPMPMPYMALVYAAMWLGALGITLGYIYRVSASVFTASLWYLLLVEKSYWNNHSYLFALLGLLLACTRANCYWSVDAYIDPSIRSETVPYWNYFVVKYQYFIVYFMAGLKKGSTEWLSGYSVPKLSEHWVFAPFRFFLTVEQTDYFIVHWFIFVFDLTITIWMMWTPSRNFAFILCALFNLMNSRLFRIGMFPWVCLAMMPLFYTFDWPKRFIAFAKTYFMCIKGQVYKNKNNETLKEAIDKKRHIGTRDDVTQHTLRDKYNEQGFNSNATEEKIAQEGELEEIIFEEIEFDHLKMMIALAIAIVNDYRRRRLTTYFILFYVVTQAFLPFSHFITKGYNNWTNGLYGYSWDMMVHSWETQSVVVKLVYTDTNTEVYIDPFFNTPNERWTRHGDMVYQYAQCLKEQIPESNVTTNISIFLDVWCSMNQRFTQRMFNTKVNLFKASWSPFERVPYLMPLLDEGSKWRGILDGIRKDVHSWSNGSDVLFFADFPGSRTVSALEDAEEIVSPAEPAFYMYTFVNTTETTGITYSTPTPKSVLLMVNELSKRFHDMLVFVDLAIKSIYQVIFQVPMSVNNM